MKKPKCFGKFFDSERDVKSLIKKGCVGQTREEDCPFWRWNEESCPLASKK